MKLQGTLKNVTFLNHLVGEVNQIWVWRNVPLSCHLNSYLSSVVALACARVLMIQRGAHSWLTAPHPSVAFSISVRPNGIRSVIIRLFTVHTGLTVNFWDMRPLSSSNLFFSELQRRFISPFWRLVCRARPQTGTQCLCSGFLSQLFDHRQLLFLEQLWIKKCQREFLPTDTLAVFDHTFMVCLHEATVTQLSRSCDVLPGFGFVHLTKLEC